MYRDLLNGKTEQYMIMVEMASNILKFNNLPKTVPSDVLSYMCLFNTRFIFYEYKGDLYVLEGDLSDKLDVYGRGTEFLFSNPIIGSKSVDYVDDKDCVLIKTTKSGVPFYKLARFDHYSNQLDELWKSLGIGVKNTRLTRFTKVSSEREKQSMEKAIEQAYNGEPVVYVNNNAYGETKPTITETMNVNDDKSLQELRETITFVNGMFLQGIGLSSQLVMKKERLITDEVRNDYPSLKVNIYDFVECLKEGIARVNARYGTDITVELNELWFPSERTVDSPIEDDDTVEEPIEETVDETVDEPVETVGEQLVEIIEEIVEDVVNQDEVIEDDNEQRTDL